MRYFVYLSYKGTAYHGWQKQPNAITVQEIMEDAFSLVLRQRISLVGAGRTDTGVHAEMMVAHFDYILKPNESTQADINAEKSIDQTILNLPDRLNNLLPYDISVHKIIRVQDDAHARFDAISRRYEYRCITRKSSFNDHSFTRIMPNLDFVQMNQASAWLMTQNDFASFCKYHTDAKTTICHLTRAEWIQNDETTYTFIIEADRFLRNMVRAIVGTLLEIGKGKLSIEQFKQIVLKCDRQAAGQSAPADGLYLVDVSYPKKVLCI